MLPTSAYGESKDYANQIWSRPVPGSQLSLFRSDACEGRLRYA